MKTLPITLLLALFLLGCSTDPRPIQFGQDVCHWCKMKLMDPHYGAEIVTQKGKIYIFDDINCLMAFMETGEVAQEDIKHVLVIDYENPEKLVDATTSFFLKSDQFKTPMASQIVAFSDYEVMNQYKKRNGGVYLAWGELVTQFK